MPMLDEMDVKILRILQQDCTRPVADIGKEVGLSTTPCWRRIQKLEEAGVIRAASPCSMRRAVNAGVTVFVSIKTDQHSLAWLEKFHAAVVDFPEVVEFYRMSGEVDYLLRVVVPDIAAYDAFYKKLIARIEISKVSSAFAMEQIKYTTALPLRFAVQRAERQAGGRPAPEPSWREPRASYMTATAPNIGVPPLATLKGPEWARVSCSGIADGRLPSPPIAATLGFALVEVNTGLRPLHHDAAVPAHRVGAIGVSRRRRVHRVCGAMRLDFAPYCRDITFASAGMNSR